jgi:osmoprotectant transport system ATP-binding protein
VELSAAVAFENVSASRGGRGVLHDVSLAVGARETVALVGRSGSGKTTLLRLVNRLIEPDAGSIRVEDRDVREWDPIALRRRTGYVIQDVGLFPHRTVAANIGTIPSLLGWESLRVATRVDELLVLVGLEPADFRDRWPDELSGGQRQRVGLARALAADPPLLLMDEPFGALDAITRSELLAEFKRVKAAVDRAVILVTHDIGEALQLADRVAVLHDGRIIACAPGPVLQRSDDPRVAALVAPPTPGFGPSTSSGPFRASSRDGETGLR